MKKLLMAVAAFGMLLTSCAKDDTVAPVEDKEALVSFCVNSPAVATRYGEGETAQDLYYAVYDTQEGLVSGLSAIDTPVTINISTTVNLNLVQGRSYEIIFWAQNANAPYTLTWGNAAAEAKMTYNPQTTLTANNEEYDAFYKYVEPITVNGAISQTVELKRPFAQLNVATADLEKARVAGVDIKKTGVKVKGVYNCLNLKSGAVPEKNAAVELTFDMTDMATGTITANGKTYSHIAMNYVLVNEKELVDVTLTLSEDNGNAATDLTRTYTSVPVQRNYRTNIIGNILTSTADFNVEIKPGFIEPAYEGFYIDEDGENATVTTTSGLHELAEMINNGEVPSDIDITLNGDIDLASMNMRSASSNWTPIGTEEKPFTGSFNGNGNTIKNLCIVETEAKEGKAFIGFFGYAKNVEIKNVTFENVYLNIACLDIDHSQGHIGAVAGSLEGTSTIENVTVKGDVKVEATFDANGASRVAVVAGGNIDGNVTMKNVHVIANEGSYLKANNNAGALAGQLQVKNVFENCSSNIDVTVKKFFAGGLIGIAAGDSTFTNCHTTGNITVTAGRAGNINDHFRVGGIAGGWADASKKVCTLVNCSYTGTLSGTNADGSVAEKFDCGGFVGRGYGAIVGSKVSVDGAMYIYAGNGVFHYVGAIVEVEGVKAIVYSVDNGVKAVSVDEITLQGKYWQDAMDWAAGLGEGWALASMEELNAIYEVRCELNDALEADSAENALFWEGDELYIKNGSIYYALYMSSDEAPAGEADANGNKYFENRVFFKQFNAKGYSDVLYSAFDCINKYAPLRDNYFARGVVTIK